MTCSSPHLPNTFPFYKNTRLSDDIAEFLCNVTATIVPRSFQEASQDERWVQAIESELQALENNHTWELTTLPLGKKAIGSKWVFKLKYKSDGTIDKHKARLVAKGFNQVHGVDYYDSFSPVAKVVTVRVFLALAVVKGWSLTQLDINNAFLHGYLDEDSVHDNCLFVFCQDNCFLMLLVYVDDLLISGDSASVIIRLKSALNEQFTIKVLGVAKYFLGLEIIRNESGIFLNQRKYVLDLLANAGLLGSKPKAVPFPKGGDLLDARSPLLQNPQEYRRLVGRLLYLGFSRPDITYSVQQLSQFLQHPKEVHLRHAIHVLKYLKGNPSLGLHFPAHSDLSLQAYSDADWASCAEYRAMASTVCELQWISYLLADIQVSISLPIPFHCDSKSAIHITCNPVLHKRTK
ncbi:hypothetical protein K2173_019991 [Erythroxylum novogranatense]|uniref:Reverse transcriptase Ty1/copia-type domain-containing protein n=1 Tax=Erythroxylum novogranatense TaxID=1862640 RepID=A0AAV8U6Q5_9ROSI|nr:hypothetical protein K2173_019991 [Erythroxylum novogranatense]